MKAPPTVAATNTFLMAELGRVSNDRHTITSRKALAMTVAPLPARAHEGTEAIVSALAKMASEILRRKCCGKAGSGCNDKNAGNGNEERVRRKPSGGHFVKSEAPLAEKSGSDGAQERGREKPSCSFSGVIQWEVSSHSLSSGTCETWFVLYCCMVSQGAVARVAFGHWVI